MHRFIIATVILAAFALGGAAGIGSTVSDVNQCRGDLDMLARHDAEQRIVGLARAEEDSARRAKTQAIIARVIGLEYPKP